MSYAERHQIAARQITAEQRDILDALGIPSREAMLAREARACAEDPQHAQYVAWRDEQIRSLRHPIGWYDGMVIEV